MAWGTPKTWAFEETPTAANMNAEIRDRMNKLFGGVSGDSEADVPHVHQSGTLAARPAPGNAGRLYTPTDLPITLYDDGTEWLIPTSGNHKVATLYNEMAEDVDLTAWETSVSGQGAVNGFGAQDNTTWRLTTGASAAGAARISNVTPADRSFVVTRVFLAYVRFILNHPTDADQDVSAGLMDQEAANPSNGIFVRKTDAGNLFGVVRSSSTDQLATDFGVTGSSLVTAIFEYDGTNMRIYKDTFNSTGLLGSVSTSLPTAQMFMGFRIADASSGAVEMLADAACVHIARS